MQIGAHFREEVKPKTKAFKIVPREWGSAFDRQSVMPCRARLGCSAVGCPRLPSPAHAVRASLPWSSTSP